MTKRLSDGSPIDRCSSTPPIHNINKINNEQYGVVRAKIVEYLPIDDNRNSTKKSQYPQPEYTCLICDGESQGQLIYHVVDSTQSGGSSNYTETIRTADNDFQATAISGKDYRNSSGDFVLIQFIQGQINTPIIIGGYKHPQAPSQATAENGVFKLDVHSNVMQKIGSDGFEVTNAGSPSLLNQVVGGLTAPVTATVEELGAVANDINDSLDGIIANCNSLPDIDLSDEVATFTSMKDSLGELVSDPTASLDSLTDMADGLAAFKNAPINVAQIKDLSSTVSALGSLVGFSTPVSFKLDGSGAASLGNTLQKMKVDKMGQAAIESIGGAGQKFAMGGISTTISPFINMNAASAFNVNSLLTKIGKMGHLPTATVGSISVGSNSAGPVISKIVNGSKNMMA